jgi:hypothetical protein
MRHWLTQRVGNGALVGNFLIIILIILIHAPLRLRRSIILRIHIRVSLHRRRLVRRPATARKTS